MTQATRNALGTSLVILLIGLHLGFFAGYYRHLWYWVYFLSDYEVQSTIVAAFTVAFLLAEAFVPILSKTRYRIIRHSPLLLFGGAQLFIFITNFKIFKDFVGVLLGVPCIALYGLLAFSQKAQVFTVESGAESVLPTYTVPSPVMHAQPAPPAYTAPMTMPMKN